MSSSDEVTQLEAQLQRVADAEARRIVEDWVEVAAAAARQQAILDTEAKRKAEAEGVGMEQGSGLPLKWKERAEGKPIVCNCCVMWGAKCQVSDRFCTIVCSTDNSR